jgi:hypothetical protein
MGAGGAIVLACLGNAEAFFFTGQIWIFGLRHGTGGNGQGAHQSRSRSDRVKLIHDNLQWFAISRAAGPPTGGPAMIEQMASKVAAKTKYEYPPNSGPILSSYGIKSRRLWNKNAIAGVNPDEPRPGN